MTMAMNPRGTVALDPGEVCTLDPHALGERLEWIRREILPHTVETRRMESGLALELRDETGLAEKLDRLIELEKECCGGIVFERMPGATADRLRLEIRGIDPDSAIFQADGAPAPGLSTRSRFFRSAGVGTLGGVFVCCIVPLGAGALFGAAAAPLASLDAPLPIALASLAGAFASWRWFGRTQPTQQEPAEGEGSCGC